jgi:hypothetical protein
MWEKHPQIKQRLSGHKQEMKNKIGGLGGHYGGIARCGYDKMSLQIIDQVEHGMIRLLLILKPTGITSSDIMENGGRVHIFRKEITRTRI